MNNLYEVPSGQLEEELTEVLQKKGSFRIERIVSTGQISDWYNQEENEWVAVIEGEAELEFLDKRVRLTKGEYLLIPRRQKHRVSYTSNPCVWLRVFFS